MELSERRVNKRVSTLRFSERKRAEWMEAARQAARVYHQSMLRNYEGNFHLLLLSLFNSVDKRGFKGKSC